MPLSSLTWARLAAIGFAALAFSLCARIELPWAWLMWVALVPWLLTLERESSAVSALWSGAATSVAFVLVVFPWFASAVARYTGLPLPLAFLLLIVCAPGLQPQFVLFAWLRRAFAVRGGSRTAAAIAAASAWVGSEWVFPRLFGDTLGHALFPLTRIRQAADLAGAGGLTFAILLVNDAFAHALSDSRRSRPRTLAATGVAVSIVASLNVYGAVRLDRISAGKSNATELAAALVQADLDDYAELRARYGTYDAAVGILDRHEALSRESLVQAATEPAIDLIVWPETVYPTTFGTPKSEAGAELDERIRRFAADLSIPLLFGTYDRVGDREYNAAILLQRDGATARADVYRKRRLFPLTERTPRWMNGSTVRGWLPWLGTWTGGDGPSVLTLYRRDASAVRLAPLICLDAVDPALALEAAGEGAQAIVTLSNDGWFSSTRGARLHLVVSAFRSIETRLPQLRATNTGISALITPSGEIAARTQMDQEAVLTGSIEIVDRPPTLMVRLGDWFGPAATIVAVLLGLLVLRPYRP